MLTSGERARSIFPQDRVFRGRSLVWRPQTEAKQAECQPSRPPVTQVGTKSKPQEVSGEPRRAGAVRLLRTLCGLAIFGALAGFGAGPLALGWLWPASLFSNLLPPIAGLLVLAAPVLWWTRSRRLALLAVLPLVVTVIWWFRVAPTPAPRAPGGSSAPHLLKLLSFNPGESVADPEQVIDLVEQLDVDVVALQELSQANALEMEARLGDRYPYRFAVATGFLGRGLWSRYPISNGRFAKLAGGRRHLICDLDVNGTPLKVVVCHLDLSAGIRGLDQSSVQDVLGLARETLEQQEATLIVGDFNSNVTSGLCSRLGKLGLVDAYREGGGAPRPSFPIAGRYPPLPFVPPIVRIDHAWRTEGLSLIHI